MFLFYLLMFVFFSYVNFQESLVRAWILYKFTYVVVLSSVHDMFLLSMFRVVMSNCCSYRSSLGLLTMLCLIYCYDEKWQLCLIYCSLLFCAIVFVVPTCNSWCAFVSKKRDMTKTTKKTMVKEKFKTPCKERKRTPSKKLRRPPPERGRIFQQLRAR